MRVFGVDTTTGAKRRHGRRLGIVVVAGAASLSLVAACGSGSSGGGGGGGSASSSTSLKVAFATPTLPAIVERIYGPLALGSQYDLNLQKSNFTAFSDSAVATQAVLSGKYDVMGGSFLSLLAARQQGQDLRAFCPYDLTTDYILAGDSKVHSISDLKSGDVKVGIDSPGGAVDAALAAQFKSLTGTAVPGKDLPNTQVITSSTLRASALGAHQIDAAIVHITQLPGIQKTAPDVHAVSKFYVDVPLFLNEVYQATGKWLASHQQEAINLCASVIAAAKQLSANRQQMDTAVENKTYVEQPTGDPAADNQLFNLINHNDFWPLDGKGFETNRINFMVGIGKSVGLLKSDFSTTNVLDEGVFQAAIAKANGQ